MYKTPARIIKQPVTTGLTAWLTVCLTYRLLFVVLLQIGYNNAYVERRCAPRGNLQRRESERSKYAACNVHREIQLNRGTWSQKA
uniref:Uncharacterized protein n=1 Tax=Glossina pallidipes TaxID=7398 RepID=A0A1A9ZMU3_GLOPL